MSQKRGEIKLYACNLANQEGETIDLSTMAPQIDIYENIFETFITATVAITDALNVLERFRLFGSEYVHIKLAQVEGVGEDAAKEFTIDKNLRVYKISRNEKTVSSGQGYLLHLIDPRAFFTAKQRLSTTYRGAISDIIANLCVDKAHISKEEFDLFEATKPDNLSFTIPNWSVLETIQYLEKQALTMDNSGVWANPFFFYQTVNGGFRFTSIDSMVQNKFPIEFTMNVARAADTDNTTPMEDKEKGVNSQILNVDIPKRFDMIEGVTQGAFAGRKDSYDLLTKISKEVIYNIDDVYKRSHGKIGFPLIRTEDDFEKVVRAEETIDEDTPPTFSEIDVDSALHKSYDSYFTRSYNMSHQHDNNDDYTSTEVFREVDFNSNSSESFERNSMIQMLHQNMFKITIPGRTDISTGMMLHAEIPMMQTDEVLKENPYDDYQYLITGIKFEFKIADKESRCVIECVKHSNAAKIEDAQFVEALADPAD